MTLLARANAPLRVAVRSRLSAPARFAHSAEYKHLPFEYKNKGAFGAKLGLYLVSGFCIPFVAAIYQLKKSG